MCSAVKHLPGTTTLIIFNLVSDLYDLVMTDFVQCFKVDVCVVTELRITESYNKNVEKRIGIARARKHSLPTQAKEERKKRAYINILI